MTTPEKTCVSWPGTWCRRTIVAVVLLLSWLAPTQATQIWLAGVDPLTRERRGEPFANSDFMSVFRPDAPWQKAADHVRIFKMGTNWTLHASDAQLSQIFADLRRRNIALAVETLTLTGNGCGRGVEGYSAPGTIEGLVARVRRLGGDLKYVAMDGPLFFGHQYSGPNACNSSIADIAKDVAAKVAAIRAVFPDVTIGDIEPVSPRQPADWLGQLGAWEAAYRDAVGEPLAFVHADNEWSGTWLQRLRALSTQLHAAGIPFGVIYDGNPDDPTGVAWTHHAEERFVALEADPRLIPDDAVLQTWMRQPLQMLPETEPGTMTNLVDRYIARQTHFSVAKDGTAVTGRLADRDGTPVVGAKITISAIEGRAATPVSVRTRMGSVPAGATRALFVLRVNEECDCSATADVAIGTMEYEAGYGGPPVRRRFPETAEKSADRAAVRFTVTTGQAIGLNTAPFPVAPNDPFTIHVPMGATASSSASGYVALIFIKDGGREAGRIRFPFEPATRPIGTAVTDATGRFAFLPPPDVLRSGPSYRVDFAGDDSHRLSSASLP